MAPGHLPPLGKAYLAPGYSTELAHFFLAEHLTPAPIAPDDDQDLRIECFSWDTVLKMIREKEKNCTVLRLWQVFSWAPT
jgi:hypothetical protein